MVDEIIDEIREEREKWKKKLLIPFVFLYGVANHFTY
jgi:hypothetical protein